MRNICLGKLRKKLKKIEYGRRDEKRANPKVLVQPSGYRTAITGVCYQHTVGGGEERIEDGSRPGSGEVRRGRLEATYGRGHRGRKRKKRIRLRLN